MVADAALGSVPADWDADRAVTTLYSTHYKSLVRLAALLVRDVATAEEVVQDSFVAMHGGWRRLRDSDKALSYLRQSVVNRSRSVLRHRMVVDRNAPKPAPDMPSAELGAIALLERSAVVAALRTLPPRQREALVLRYYGGTFLRPRSPRRWASPGAPSKATRPVPSPRCVSCWSVRHDLTRARTRLRAEPRCTQQPWRRPSGN
jgi:RNA polymerase sigma factor (sigma-70 family)